MAGSLVGRSQEWSHLRAALDAPGLLLVVHGEAGVGKTHLVRSVLAGVGHREGGALATLSWLSFLALRRAFPDLAEDAWRGDPEHAAALVETALGDHVLLLEDQHWADAATLRAVEVLAGRVRMVLTVRRGDPGADAVLAVLAGLGAEVLDLHPLAPEDASLLVERVRPGLSTSQVDSVVARSGGNPLMIEELAAADGDVTSLELAVLARCRGLREGQVEGLATLALAGRPLPPAHVREAEGLAAAGLVVRDQAGRLAIRHALVGEVVAGLLSEERRVRCHRALAECAEHPGDRARHLLAAGEPAAAHAQAMRAVQETVHPGERWRHLVVAAESAPPEAATGLRLDAAEAANGAVEPAEALRILAGLDVEPAHRARCELARAVARYQSGDHAGYREAVLLAEQWAAPGSHDAHAVLLKRCSVALLLDNDQPEAVRLATRARALAHEQGLPTGGAAKALGTALSDVDGDGWQALLAEAVAEGRQREDVYLEMTSAFNWVFGLQLRGDVEAARALAEESAARARELRLSRWEWSFQVSLLACAAVTADVSFVLGRAPALLALPLKPSDRYDVLATLGECQVAAGDIAAGLAVSDELAEHSGYASNARLLSMQAHFMAGRPDRALAEWRALQNVPGADDFQLLDAAPLAAWAARECREPVPAVPVADRARGLFAGAGEDVAGVRALEEGRHRDAAAHFAEAARRHGPALRAVLLSRWGEGEALRLAGDPGAEAHLRATAARSREAGLAPLATRCERSLRAMGVRVRRAGDRVGSMLSPREAEVADLAAEGLTDREIAARLGIAHRTVQTQLASARRKLGADTRTELAALVAGER